MSDFDWGKDFKPDEETPPAFDWGKDFAPDEPAKPKDPGLGRSLVSKAVQGIFKGGSDELAGHFYEQTKDHENAAWKQPDGSMRFAKSGNDMYRGARDTEREVLKGADEHHFWPGMAAQVLGDVGSDVALRLMGVPVHTQAYQTLMGGLNGFLANDADLTADKVTPRAVADATDSAAIGAGASYALPIVGKVVANKLKGSSLAKYLQGKITEAGERATAMGAEKAAKETASAVGKAGGETVHGSNIVKTLTMLHDVPIGAQAPESYAEFLRKAAADATAMAKTMDDRAVAGGVDGDTFRIDPEFAGKAGSTLEKARAAKQTKEFWERAAKTLLADADEVAKTGIVPDSGAKEILEKALSSPELSELKGNVVINLAKDLPGQATRSKAARTMADEAIADQPVRASKYADDLLSGKAFLKGPVMDRVLRYGPPIVGSGVGSMFGGEIGAMAGVAAGAAAGQGLGAMAGSGMRPALKSIQRLVTQYPFAQKLWAENLHRMVTGTPELLGKYGPVLAREAQRGAESLWAMDEALTAEDPEYAAQKAKLLQQQIQEVSP